MEKELTPVQEFLHKFSIPRTSFYREVNTGRLKTVKRGRRTFITRAAADKWLKSLPEGQPSQSPTT